MGTKLYLHDVNNDWSGTFPTGEQSGRTPTWSAAGASTLRKMDRNIQSGASDDAVLSGTTSAVTTAQTAFFGFWTSPPLAGSGNLTTTPSTLPVVNLAHLESNTNVNLIVDDYCIYLWRPSTGAMVGTALWDTNGDGSFSGPVEPGSANTERVSHGTVTAVSRSRAYQDGDVIILEAWAVFSQGMATAYTASIYFDGATEDTTNNATVTNHASFIEFADTLSFQNDSKSLILKPNDFFNHMMVR